MTEKEFHETAERSEDEFTVTYDCRPFGDQQQEAGAWYLGNAVFKSSLGDLNTGQKVTVLVDDRFETTDQLEGFIEKLEAKGLTVEVREALTVRQQLTRALQEVEKQGLTNPQVTVRFNGPKEVVNKAIGDGVDLDRLEAEISEQRGYIVSVVGDRQETRNVSFTLRQTP